MKNYKVTISREGKWWMVAIPEIDGLTQARTIKEAHEMAKEYIAATLDIPMDSFGIHVQAERIGTVEHVTQILEDIKIERAQAEKMEREANDRARQLAKELAAQDVTLRDIGELFEVSHQRAHQLVKA